ncbi:RNA-directed DNA polymerase, eukaryota, reverse transcriptase zinc-binding domain protein [Tanacetum coccineum]
MAFPVVKYYVKNNWAKYGLKRIMMNAKGFFFYKFDSQAGLDAVLEGGPWMVRNSPIILKKWSMKTSLQKEELTRILIWVKLHDVPIQEFEEDGISVIATYLGKPIMLDSYTSSMCKDSWGRSSFAWCLIEINSEADFMESITIGIPDLDGPGWMSQQPKASNVGSNCNTGTRGETSSKAGPSKNTNDDALLITKGTNARQHDTGKKKISNIASPNPFAALGVDEDEEEEVENIWDESKNLNLRDTGASTPAQTISDVYVYAIFESHVDVAAVYDTCKKVCSRWKWTYNGSLCHACADHLAGGYEPNAAMRKFKECVQTMEVADVNSTALHFTWNKKPKGSNGILKKNDRIIGNLQFNDDFPGSFAIFQPYRISDHSPCVLRIPTIMRNYHRRRSPPRCPFKVNIQKAYDTVDWSFLETILVGFGFHPKMVQWIMVCVSGVSYSICVNGNLHGWFKA